MLTPAEALLVRQQFVRSYADGLIAAYSDSLSTQLPKDGYYQVGAPSCPPFTDQEKEEIHKILEQAFTDAGWSYQQTNLIFSYKLKPL